MSAKIPFNKSSLQGRELEYIFQAMTSGQIAGDQQFSRRCQTLLESTLGVKRALVTTSCTHALEMAAFLLNIKPGDEVIVPSFTFVSTANAFVTRGARPVFCDVRSDTCNLDERLLESLITPRTRAIVPVHYAGVGCEMDRILEIAHAHQISVVEDNAHGLFGKYRGRPLGSLGALATLSFHETKNISCGEGGALLINDEQFVERAEIIREKGTDRSRFFRGEVDKYSWVDLGSSYVMSDVLAAFLFAQLESWQVIQQKRERIWRRYHESLSCWCVKKGVRQPTIPSDRDSAWHMYYLEMPSVEKRQRLMDALRQQGILAVFHYQSLHRSSYALRMGLDACDCPVSDRLSDCLLRLPFWNEMSIQAQDQVINAIVETRLD